jgi:hypothetical protein
MNWHENSSERFLTGRCGWLFIGDIDFQRKYFVVSFLFNSPAVQRYFFPDCTARYSELHGQPCFPATAGSSKTFMKKKATPSGNSAETRPPPIEAGSVFQTHCRWRLFDG